MKRRLAYLGGTGAIFLALSACGQAEANNYNLPSPHRNIENTVWTRIWTPKEYSTLIRGCVDGDGIYETQSGGTSVPLFVVPHDPACKG